MLLSPFNAAPACGAKTRRGTSCLCPAMPNGRCKLHGGKVPSGPACVHYRHGQRTKAAEQESKDLTQLSRLMRLVEKLAPGDPVTPEMVRLYEHLRARFYAGDLRRAEWQRMAAKFAPVPSTSTSSDYDAWPRTKPPRQTLPHDTYKILL
jgi:hypothetical protein